VHLSTGGWRIKTVPSGCPQSTWPGCAAPEPSPQVRRPQDHFGSMPVMMLAVQLWVLSAPSSRAGGAAGFVPG